MVRIKRPPVNPATLHQSQALAQDLRANMEREADNLSANPLIALTLSLARNVLRCRIPTNSRGSAG